MADGHRVRRHRGRAVLVHLEVRRPRSNPQAGEVHARQPHAGSRVDDPAGGDAAVHRHLPDERLGRRQDAAARTCRSRAEVTGRQFKWDFRYPGPDGELYTPDDIVRVDGEIHFPAVDEEVLLIIKSHDVLHSFFLPNLRMKQDVVPGMEQYMWFKAARPAAVRHRVCRAVRLGPLQDEGPGDVRVARRLRRMAGAEIRRAGNAARSTSTEQITPRFPTFDHQPHDTVMSTITADHSRPSARRARPPRQLSVDVRLLARSQDHRHPVPVPTLIWFLVGGLLALGVRWQLAWPWSRHADHRQDAVLGRRRADLARSSTRCCSRCTPR